MADQLSRAHPRLPPQCGARQGRAVAFTVDLLSGGFYSSGLMSVAVDWVAVDSGVRRCDQMRAQLLCVPSQKGCDGGALLFPRSLTSHISAHAPPFNGRRGEKVWR